VGEKLGHDSSGCVSLCHEEFTEHRGINQDRSTICEIFRRNFTSHKKQGNILSLEHLILLNNATETCDWIRIWELFTSMCFIVPFHPELSIWQI
jgi:predicted ATPase